jgi:SAM-dependent methyltransferase
MNFLKSYDTNGSAVLPLCQDAASCQLSALMDRVNVRLDPSTFIETVAVAFKEAQAQHQCESMANKFRAEPSFQLFENAIRLAQRAGNTQSIFVLGCGRGFAGEPADFALSVVREVFDSTKIKEAAVLNLTPSILRLDREALFANPQLAGKQDAWDLVVIHSLLHYVPDVSKVFDLIRGLLKRCGGLIVSHEPNARFWQNAKRQSALAKLQRKRPHRRLRQYLNRSGAFQLLRRTRARPSTIWDRVNMLLKERCGLASPLAENEIRRLVDIHRPESVPGTFCIGQNGFDFDELSRIHLPDFRLQWVATTDHLGYVAPTSLTAKWQRMAMALAEDDALAGCVFTGYWSRDAVSRNSGL